MPALNRLIVTITLALIASAVLAQPPDTPRVDGPSESTRSALVAQGAIESKATSESNLKVDKPSPMARELISDKAEGNYATAGGWGLVAILAPLLTAIVLFISLIVSYRTYLHNTRPVISFTIEGNPIGLHLNPRIRNLSKTDAVGIAVMNFNVNGKLFSCETDPGAYSGKTLWHIPATHDDGVIRGNVNIRSPYMQMCRCFPKRKVTGPVYLELSMHYIRYERRSWPAFSWFRAKYGWPTWFASKVFTTPLQRWELKRKKVDLRSNPPWVTWESLADGNLSLLVHPGNPLVPPTPLRVVRKWVLKPDFIKPQKPLKISRKLFFGSSEKKT